MKPLLLLSFLLSGLSALVYEVVWTRALSLVLGSTVYSLSTMLATFMLGLAVGSFLGGRLADRSRNLFLIYGISEAFIGLSGLISIPLIYNLPPLFFKLYQLLRLNPPAFFVSQFFIAGLVMLLPTVLMGVTFPVVSRLLTGELRSLGRSVGNAYSFNTAGAILGSVLGGFLLIPELGLKGACLFAGIINLLVGITFIIISGRKRLLPGLCLSFVFLLYPFFKTQPKDYFATFYMAERFSDLEELRKAEASYTVLFEKDHAQGFVRALRDEGGFLVLQHGGKMEGTGLPDSPNTLFLASLPVEALSRRPERLLVIGLGAGITCWQAKALSDHVEVVEINPAVIEVVERFGYPDTLTGVELHRGDARQYLLYRDERYDIITSEPSVPSEAMSANLFTLEFYLLARERLKQDGVMAQWVPGWALKRDQVRSCIKTFAKVFPYVYVYKVKASKDFILLGSLQPLRKVLKTGVFIPDPLPPVFNEMKKIGDIRPLFEIELVRDAESVKEIIAMEDIPLITDDRPLIEFWTTRNFLE